ncbi:rod shape-determining protein MreC [Alphaproteobacteria bacterium]|jgi:rod shape-determining protein MreC|nr:rod shape-determining protein MreC [Alphaproteobacteria bacterium]
MARGSDKGRVRRQRTANVLLILLSFSLMFLGKADIAALRNARMGASDFMAPLMDIVSSPVRGIDTMVTGIRTVTSLRAENVRLEAENDLLKRWRRRAEILESENRQLRSVTGAVAPERRTPLTARAVTAPGGSFAHTVLIAVGYESGIRAGNPVVTADGLVGLVVDVGKSYARVLMISDINARIPVILASSSWPALAIGQNGVFLELAFLPEEAKPQIGELVLTSGHGGVLPAGLPVGRVNLVQDNFVRVQPAVDFRSLSYVSVLTGGIEGIDTRDLSLGDYYTPLPIDDKSRLLEGLNAVGERQ